MRRLQAVELSSCEDSPSVELRTERAVCGKRHRAAEMAGRDAPSCDPSELSNAVELRAERAARESRHRAASRSRSRSTVELIVSPLRACWPRVRALGRRVRMSGCVRTCCSVLRAASLRFELPAGVRAVEMRGVEARATDCELPGCVCLGPRTGGTAGSVVGCSCRLSGCGLCFESVALQAACCCVRRRSLPHPPHT